MGYQDKNKTDIIPAHFEVYSPWTQRAAGIGGIAFFFILILVLAVLIYYILKWFMEPDITECKR